MNDEILDIIFPFLFCSGFSETLFQNTVEFSDVELKGFVHGSNAPMNTFCVQRIKCLRLRILVGQNQFYYLSPTSLFWFLLGPNFAPNIAETSFPSQLIQTDIFYVNCHLQLMLNKFSNTHSSTHTRKANFLIEFGLQTGPSKDFSKPLLCQIKKYFCFKFNFSILHFIVQFRLSERIFMRKIN